MQEDLELTRVEEILRGIRIPPQPQILVDIQLQLAMPDFDVDEISRLIARDVGLSGRVLKTVNSPYFGIRNTITSINQAITLLGINSVVNIVNAMSLKDALSDQTIVALTGFWDIAIDTAQTCAYVSKSIGFSSQDEAYALGLFHDSGIPLLMDRFSNYLEVLKSAYANPQKRITEHEFAELNTNHAIVGYYIAKSWKLPKHLCDAIAEHHDCYKQFAEESAKESEKRNLLAILKLSEHLCSDHSILADVSADHEFERIKQPLLRFLGISEIDVENLRDELVDQGLIVPR